MAALPRAGDVIAGKYAVVRVLGEGGMGVVFEATHVRLRQRVAIKMLLPAMMQHGVLVERFEREARAAAQLKGRHVARVMDVDVTLDGLPYMVMEFLEGRDLQVEIEQRGPLGYAEAVDYVLQACAAMAEAHGVGIVHRDLKPSNLFLANDGGARVVKVLDFGISKYQTERDVKLTDAHAVMGTALYMSPEQVKASAGVDGRTDIWSLGVILWEVLAGRPPWIGSPTQIAAAIVMDDPPDLRSFCPMPPELATVLAKALERNPADRFSDVRQLAVALAPFASFGSIGRAYADALSDASANSGSSQRLHSLPVPPASDSAPTVINLAASTGSSRQAVSLTPSAPGESRRDRTAPGWSSHGETRKRNRGLLLGAGVAFITVLAFGGAAMMKFGPKTTAHAEPSASASPSSTSPPVLDDPPPPPMETAAEREPAPPPTSVSAPSSASASATAKTTARPSPAAPTPTPTPKPAAKPSAAPDGKPLFL